MPEKQKGDDVTVRTRWTGSLYDSSYYFNPYMEKYRIDGQVKLPFFLTPDKHYVGVAWYQKRVTVPDSWKGERVVLFLERPHIETTVWINRQEVGMQNSGLAISLAAVCRTAFVYPMYMTLLLM